MPVSLNSNPATLPLKEIHLPESVGWWPPAPGWWLLPCALLLGVALFRYGRFLHRRRKYSAVNMAQEELTVIRTHYAADRDAGRCVRAVSGLLRRLSISLFPRTETAGLTGAEWLAFLQGQAKEGGQGTSGQGRGETDERLNDIGGLLLEAPYRRQVAEEEVEALIDFCSGWIEAQAGRKP